MKIRFIFYSIFLFPIFFSSCQKGGTASGEPELVVRQYQKYIDNNRFEAAKKISTLQERRRLERMAADLAKEKHDAILRTEFLHVSCEEKRGIALCLCDLRDQYEDYSLVYKLVQSDGRWLIDAPERTRGQEEAQIVQELLDQLYD